MDRPLSDLVVLDLTRALAGPIASRLLSDLGARVIKIEPPDGDLTRSIVPRVDSMSVYFAAFNAGKRCVSMDLTKPEGRDLFLTMVERADIVLENYRPSVMARLGLDHDVLLERNPRIILASVSGWGHGNSRSEQGAYASAIQAEAGVTAMVAKRRGDAVPINDPMSHADVYTGLHALAAVLAAVHLRDRTGVGQRVEVSMAESMLVANDLAAMELTGEDPDVGFRAGQNWSSIFALRTGRYVNITLDFTTNGGFDAMTRAIGRPELATDPRFAALTERVRHREELTAEIAAWVSQFDTAAELEAAIGQSTVLAAEVLTVAELADTRWAAEREAFVTIDVGRGETIAIPQAPWRFAGADSGVVPIVGFRGQHNREVLAEFADIDDEALQALTERKIISQRVPDWLQG